MMFSHERLWSVPGDEAWKVRERARKRREYTLQAVLILLLVALLASLSLNVMENLEARNIRHGFDFLWDPAGFDIGEKLFAFRSSDELWKAFGIGLLNTLRVSALSIVTSTVLGAVVGLMRISRHPMLQFLGAAHVEAYRNVPLLVLLLAVYLCVTELLPGTRAALSFGGVVFLSKAGLLYAVPASPWALWAALGAAFAAAWAARTLLLRRMTGLMATVGALGVFVVVFAGTWLASGFLSGWDIPKKTRFSMSGGAQLSPEFLSLWLGLTLFTSAAIAEIVRAGIKAVRPGQWSAGLALGLTNSETVSYVIFPQSMRLAIPPLASQYMNLTKNSSLAVMVGYPDIVNISNTAINVTAQALEVIALIMAVYLTVNLVIALVMNGFNRIIMRAPQ